MNQCPSDFSIPSRLHIYFSRWLCVSVSVLVVSIHSFVFCLQTPLVNSVLFYNPYTQSQFLKKNYIHYHPLKTYPYLLLNQSWNRVEKPSSYVGPQFNFSCVREVANQQKWWPWVFQENITSCRNGTHWNEKHQRSCCTSPRTTDKEFWRFISPTSSGTQPLRPPVKGSQVVVWGAKSQHQKKARVNS